MAAAPLTRMADSVMPLIPVLCGVGGGVSRYEHTLLHSVTQHANLTDTYTHTHIYIYTHIYNLYTHI